VVNKDGSETNRHAPFNSAFPRRLRYILLELGIRKNVSLWRYATVRRTSNFIDDDVSHVWHKFRTREKL